MGAKYRRMAIYGLLGIIVLAGQALTTHSQRPATAPDQWEIVRQIEYDTIPKENLQGEIGRAYLRYLVSLAGFHTDTFGITIGPDDDARFTTDGGQNWTKAPSELMCRYGLEIVDENVAWHCGNGGTRVTTNSGRTWQTVEPSECPNLSFLDAQLGWSASPTRLQATADGGASWHTIALPPDIEEIATVALRTPDDGYVLDTSGDLYVTEDGGESWEAHSPGLLNTGERLISGSISGPFTTMRFLDRLNGIVVFALSDRTVWSAITYDGGQTWQRSEIQELRDQSYYYHLFLSRDGRFLTVTDGYLNGENRSILLRYREG